jgi:[acyl-carrier-protein] S-malonyltransferase
LSLAALFPGQNSQAVGMSRDLYDNSNAAKAVLDEAETTLPGLLQLMWQGPAEELQLTANQQPALVAAGIAAFNAYLEAGGARPSFAAGHSLGEFTAHVAAGSLQLADALRLVRRRGELMQQAVPAGQGAMAAILKLETELISRILTETPGVVELANLNSPGQTVISGEAAAVAAASQALREAGGRVIPLKVSAPFHCSLMQDAADALAPLLQATQFGSGEFPVISNVTAEAVVSPAEIPALLIRQVTAPVRWVESLEELQQLGAQSFLEFGSGKVLTGLTARTLPGAHALAISDSVSLQEALA